MSISYFWRLRVSLPLSLSFTVSTRSLDRQTEKGLENPWCGDVPPGHWYDPVVHLLPIRFPTFAETVEVLKLKPILGFGAQGVDM